jgi:hypothetical protein
MDDAELGMDVDVDVGRTEVVSVADMMTAD